MILQPSDFHNGISYKTPVYCIEFSSPISTETCTLQCQGPSWSAILMMMGHKPMTTDSTWFTLQCSTALNQQPKSPPHSPSAHTQRSLRSLGSVTIATKVMGSSRVYTGSGGQHTGFQECNIGMATKTMNMEHKYCDQTIKVNIRPLLIFFFPFTIFRTFCKFKGLEGIVMTLKTCCHIY